MSKVTKTFVSNSAKSATKIAVNKQSSIKFVAKISSVSVNRRVTISSNFSIAKVKK